MKKILLALMIFSSLAFSQFAPTYILYNSTYYVRSYVQNEIKDMSSKLPTSAYSNYQTPSSNIPNLTIYEVDSLTDLGTVVESGTTFYYYMRRWVVYIPKTTTDCSNGTIVDGQCISPVDVNNAACDPIASQFTNSTTGKCDECMSFTSFSGRASCACNAYGSTYTPVKGIAYYYTLGNYTYKKQRVTCDDGTQTFVYYDPLNNNPQDYNTTTPSDSNTTTPSDNNTTTSPVDLNGTVVPTPSQADVVNALKSIENGQKDSNTALKELGVDLKTVNTQLTQQGYTFNSILDKIIAGNEKADSRYKLMDDEFKGQTQYRNMMGKWVDDDLKNASAQLGATVGVKDAVNTQGTAITDKLGEILQAIKDSNGTGKEGNGTDMTPTNDLLEKIKGDTNATVKGLDKLHEDINSTNSLLDKISGFFDNNDSYKTPDINGTEFELSDLLPDESWFETNKLNLNFNNYGGDCYCQTAEFTVAGKTFIFPPQEALDVIPFNIISNIFMAFIFVLGAKDFLRD